MITVLYSNRFGRVCMYGITDTIIKSCAIIRIHWMLN